jgi:hypothetical protein
LLSIPIFHACHANFAFTAFSERRTPTHPMLQCSIVNGEGNEIG